jgi:hypothetical protein
MPSSVERDGIAYATVARAVIDACRRIKRLDTVREIVAESVQSNKCSAKELLEELRHAQRRGSALPRRVLREIAAGIRSVAEAKAREWLRRAGVPEPDWNADLLDTSGNWIASPDGYWEDVAVALEIDSMEWHLRPRLYKRTQRRQRRMASYNITVLPVAPGDIIDDPDAFVAEVIKTRSAARNRPLPDVRVRRKSAA